MKLLFLWNKRSYQAILQTLSAKLNWELLENHEDKL